MADSGIVSIPHQCARGIPTGREEGKLVTRRRNKGICGTFVYYGEKANEHWVASVCRMDKDMSKTALAS